MKRQKIIIITSGPCIHCGGTELFDKVCFVCGRIAQRGKEGKKIKRP